MALRFSAIQIRHMKKIYFLFVLTMLSFSGFSQLLTEEFNSTPDNTLGLETHSGGAWIHVNTGDSILVTSGSLTYPGLATSAGNKVAFDGAGTDYYTNFTSQTTGSVYRSFILNVSALGGMTTTGGYFNGFIQSGSTTAFGGTVWARLSTTAGKFNIGISTRSNSVVTWLPTDFTPGTPVFVVAAYDFNAGTGDDVARVWVNTANIGGSEPAADATAAPGTDMTSCARVLLRQDAATTTPFIEYDELRVGTTWAQVTPSGGPTPVLSATALTAFGAQCINNTYGPNSFTITGTNLNTTNVTVGALAGFTYSTTAGGTYTTSLSLTQPGGAYSQQIFVKFNPTAVQSYDGNIPVGGGGAPSINVAASGSGIDKPVVTSGAASSITSSSATVAGTITAIGCSAISAYGIEYSTTNAFPNGTGTAVPASNLSAGNFSSNLSGLAASTVYYYHAYATNGSGTGYGAQGTFTTTAATGPTVVISQIYGGGGNAGATYNQDFIEIFNKTTSTTVDISNWSVQYSSAAGTTWAVTSVPAATTIAPGKYYLFALATGANGVALPVSADVTNGTVNLSGTAGKVALVNSSTPLSGATACSDPSVMDVVGYGSTASCAEGALFPATGITTAQAIFRKVNGCTDTNDNSADMELLNVNPRNSGTTANICGLPSMSATALTAFGAQCVNGTYGPNSFTITGNNLTAVNVTVAALAGYTYSTTAGGTYTTTLSLTQPGGAYSQQIFVKFNATAVQSYNGNIVVGDVCASNINVAASRSGISCPPTLSASALTAFGAQCINGTYGPNSFTITGSNLTAANVDIAALAGFTYSTTAAGTYTTTLSLTQPGGAYSQQIFVKFSPTAVQSYNGNIVVGGGGASNINVAASGSGINSVPTLTTGAASLITATSATLAGTINATGCTAVSAYGVEYSTTNGFPNGTGTPVPASNLAGGNFSSPVSGLTPATTYYYHAYATNGAGTGYGAQQQFTTATPGLSATALTAFGAQCINGVYGPNSFTITGTNLTSANVTVGALAGFTYSTTAGGTYTTSLSLTQPGGAYSQQIFVKFNPTAVQSYDGNIPVGGGGAPSINVAASGSGIDKPVVTSGAASSITSSSATVAGTITAIGCSAISAYGIEYSTTNAFPNGTGTAVPASNLSAGNFSSNLSGLAASTVYYYHAYATNGSGTGYGAQGTFTTTAATGPTVVISQIYGGGGNAGATYNQDFIEIFNKTTSTTVDISNWSVQYSSAAGTTWAVTSVPAATTIAPGKYYLFALATGANGVALPVSADVTNGTVNLSGTAGKVALVNSSTPLSGATACSDPSVMDVVGYGSTASCAEGALFPATGITTAQAIFRKVNGCTDTNDNSADMELLNVNPRNSGTPANICGLPSMSATALTAFGAQCVNGTYGPNSFTITGNNLTAVNVTVAALAGYTYSTTAGGTYTTTLSLTQPGGAYSQQIFVKFNPTAVQSYNGNIVVGGGGASNINVAASGSGISCPPTLSASALTAFGAQCINGTYGPNSFTITGSNLTAANVDIAALAGFTYSTTAAGTYTTTLSLTQPGGAYSQQIFVKFSPTAVQSYDGNIVVGGGGASNINVAASGSGINSVPTLTTGAASLITATSATLAGTINATGCTAVSAYGVEYSTTNGFPNGTGTPVPASNLAGGNFSSPVSGLTPATTYYYHAYATNGAGTGYGAQQQFTTATPGLSATALTAFGAQCINGVYGPNSFTITGTNLTSANVTVGALAGFTYSTTAGGTYTTTLSLSQPGGSYSQQIFVKFSPTAVQSYSGNIPVGG